jgi:hypothetical protein
VTPGSILRTPPARPLYKRRMNPMRPLAASLALLPVLAGCAAQGPGYRIPVQGSVSAEQTVFPTQEAIARIAAAPVPARALDEQTKDVPTWTLTGPLPDAVERAAPVDDTPWGKLFAEAVVARGDGVVATEAMHCVARENAAFYLANDALPAEMLGRFIAGRCGAPTSLASTSFSLITGDARTPDEKLLAQFHDRIRALVDKTLALGRVEAGFAFVRNGGRAALAISVVPQTVRVERTPLVPGPDGKLVIEGEALGPAIGVRALVNRGRYGYAVCEVSPAVALPRFSVACPVAPDDEVAWLSVAAMPPGRVLGMPLLEMLAWPSGKPGKVYEKLARGAAGAEGASATDLVQEINRVRAEAKLPPVRLAEQESRTATRLAPHYFAASEGAAGMAETADQIALGLLAGWEVDGMVRNGHFISTWLGDAGSWAEVIRGALSRPVGRETLLDPAAERVAVGTFAEGHGSGALFSTYALFDAYRHDGDAREVATRIASLRALRRAAPLRLVTELMEEAQRAADSAQLGRRTPEQALGDMIDRAASRVVGHNVRGWVAETTSFDRMKLPPELSSSPALALGIGAAHHKRAGAAWGSFLVFLVMIDDRVNGPNTARREGDGAG